MPVPLHTLSWYSLLEGTASPEQLLRRAAAHGYTALALTDVNNIYAAVPFREQAEQYGLRPLLGACLRQGRQQCIALVAEPTGYRSLCRVLSRLHLTDEGLASLLAGSADGLHVLVDERPLAEELRDAFGPRLWLEVVRPALPGRADRDLLAWGRRLGLRPIASTAAHLSEPDEYAVYRLLTAVRAGTLLDALPEQLAIGPAHHLASSAELGRRFRDLPEAVRNTDALAEQLRADVLPRSVILPPPRLPHTLGEVRFLHLLCERGLRRRDLGDDRAARQRLREELAVIEAGGMAGYFLVVRDIARYARRKRHGIALRGSAGNSLVCYLLEITDVDPLRFGLPLERFLHPGRVDLPDIDLDFDWKVRDDVLAYVFRRYGPRHTAMISSHLFLQPASAFREAAKAHGLSNDQISRLPAWGGEAMKWRGGGMEAEKGLENQPVVSALSSVTPASPPRHLATPPPDFPLEPERWPRLLADARRLQGRPHHLSIHPGGVVITPQPVEDYVPLQRAPKGIVITQFDKDTVEQIGLVKIDLLGNRALSTVDEACRLVANGEWRMVGGAGRAASGNLSALRTHHSPLVIQMLRQGDTIGVNQLESPAMRHLLVQMRPEGLDDVIRALALIRPGAADGDGKKRFVRCRRGLETACYPDPRLESLLRDTYGLILFEDDVLRVVQALTGLPAPAADRLRKRIVKRRDEDEARQLAAEFTAACARQGVTAAAAAAVWAQLAKFNRYSFCKSHAVSYGLIAWQALHLKAHHPREFWTAALNNNQGMYPRRVYVEAIKRAGIPLRLPCVNRSAGPFTVEDDAIRVGLDAVASLPDAVKQAILAERQQGPYRDLADFRRRVAPPPEALALLIRCGALDWTGRPRPALFLEAELQDRAGRIGNPLFPGEPGLDWGPADYTARQRLRDEWLLLGFVVGPPLLSLFRHLLPSGLVGSRRLREHVGRRVRVAGVAATTRYMTMNNGQTMQFLTLEDEESLIEVTLFPGTCPPISLATLGPYIVRGVVEEQYGELTVTVEEVEVLREE